LTVSDARAHSSADDSSKKSLILDAARALHTERFTPVEIEQIRRQLVARLGPKGKTSFEYVTSVLEEAGMRVLTNTQPEADGPFEEEFQDLLHFSTLEEAEMCLIRLDELHRKFVAGKERHSAERVLEIARLGRRRADMIARNQKVDPAKRAQKAEIARWFAIWLDTPDTFFDWLDVRKKAPEFQSQFSEEEAE